MFNNLTKFQKRNNGILHFLPGDLTSTTSFKNEVYPVVVLENSIANEQKYVTLMSSSGRISYGSSNFLRFWSPNFIKEPQILHSKDRLQGKMRAFSRDMTTILEANKEIFYEITCENLRKDGIIYEEDLVKQVFKEPNDEARFAVHKFLFEGGSSDNWIKDGQWSLTDTSSGPYVLRPQWQLELIYETEEALKNFKDLDQFRRRIKESLTKKESFKIISKFDELILKCLKAFCNEFYINSMSFKNPFKKIVTEAFLGVAIIDSQSQGKSLLSKLEESHFVTKSKPLINSYINERLSNIEDETIENFNIISSSLEFHDFGDLPVYLIDPIGTVEVDDGISVERTNSDSIVILHVHVADPSDLVSGKLEEVAKFKAETIYLPEMKIKMLPDKITEMTTLKTSGVKTLTFSCKIDLETGDLTDYQIRRGIINNLKHFTYEEAEEHVNRDFDLMKRIRIAHLKYRDSRGHLNFSFPRGVAQLDSENEKILVKLEDNLLMKKVVAESMIIAGRIAGEYLKERKIYGPFRNHNINNNYHFEDVESKSLLEKYEILKGFESGSVDFIPKKHGSMGLEAYVKVTSPLRRYLDLVTHKILKAENGNSKYGKEWFIRNLDKIHRQELYNKRLSFSVNRFWIEKFIWQQEKLNCEQIWTLTILEKLKDDLWMVHVNEVENNFIVSIRGGKFELGENIKSKIIGDFNETLLKFEIIK